MIASRSFQGADQIRFAELSGDWNPIHVDEVAARRTQAGTRIVHGVHGVLWALEEAAGHLPLAQLRTLRVKFERFITLDQPARLVIAQQDEASARLEILVGGTIATIAVLAFGPRKPEPAPLPVAADSPRFGPARQDVRVLDLPEIAGQDGYVASAAPDTDFAQAFPALSAAIGAARVSALAALSRLVGMACPGLHSVFMKITIDLHDGAESDAVAFRVKRLDDRFRLAVLEASGRGLAGTVECLVRMPPVAQPQMAELKTLVKPGEFAGSVALIVGGSRGLGELTAKLVAAGGGHVIVTYLVGRDEALAVAADIRAHGGTCDVLPYDARLPAAPQLEKLPAVPTHLYYFATTRIFRQKTELYEPGLFREFLGVYVEAFHDLCAALNADERPLAAFYPSSVAVEDRPRDMTEYAMAKAAGETLCADLAAFQPGMRVLVHRLPRLLTDQTATTVQVETAPAEQVMLPLIRQTQAL